MPVTYRPGTEDDHPAIFAVVVAALADLEVRTGVTEADSIWRDPDFVTTAWDRNHTMLTHVTRTAEQFWVATLDGGIVGYARATLRDEVRQLTDLFVHPNAQGSGIGRELLSRTFPVGGARRRVIVASADIAALTSYLKAGVTPCCPITYTSGRPRPVEMTTDLTFEPLPPGAETLALLGEIDRAVLGFARDVDHAYLLEARQGMCYRRNGEVMGYGYVGRNTGPIALHDATDFPAVLAQAETMAATQGAETFGVETPLVNRVAIDHLLRRGFRLDQSLSYWMADEPLGDFTRYLLTSPPIFV